MKKQNVAEKKCSITEDVYNFKAKYPQGLTDDEIQIILKNYPDINMDKFDDVLTGITGFMTPDGTFLIYRSDIVLAITCGVENRNMRSYEFD